LFIEVMHRGGMKKASEYREHAQQCRELAKGMTPGEQRDQLLEMATTWEKLAAERSDLVRRHPELSIGEEHAEEIAAAPPSSG
jgi:hypothetical protein